MANSVSATSGPWLRRHHNHDDAGCSTYDPKCQFCMNKQNNSKRKLKVVGLPPLFVKHFQQQGLVDYAGL